MTLELSEPRARVIPGWDLTDRLRKAREHAGLDQVELADALGISRTSVGNYENGRRVPSRPYLIAWADVTGVVVEWLETGMAPVEDDEGQESRLPESNRRPIHYMVATHANLPILPDYSTGAELLALIDGREVIQA